MLLNSQARYVRLETTQVNDGSGWSLGLREIWVTGGRDDSAEKRQLRPHAVAADGLIRLTWNNPPLKAARLRLHQAETPNVSGTVLLTGPAESGRYVDRVKNWVPHYYWIEAIDADGKTVQTSDMAAAFAHPRRPATGRVETFAFWYEPYKPTTDPDASLRHIGHGSFVVGPGAGASADLVKAGMGLLPYVTLYQTSRWAGSFPSTADPRTVAKKIAPIAFFRPSLHYAHAAICRRSSAVPGTSNTTPARFSTPPVPTAFPSATWCWRMCGNSLPAAFSDFL